MKKIFLLLVVAFLIPIWADNWRNLNELHKDLKGVGLDIHQEKEVKKLFEDYHRNLKKWWEDNYKTDSLVMKNFVKNDFKDDDIKDRFKEIYDKKTKMDLKFLKQLHSILTEEQRDKISQEFTKKD